MVRRMGRVVRVIALLVLGCGSGSEPAPAAASSGAEQGQAASGAQPPPPSPQPPAPPPPLPEPFEATLTTQVRIPLPVIAALVDAQLPQHEAKGMEPLTREGKSPALEASYDIWRDPVALRFEGKTLQVDVPVRYAARFNARVKSPFGGWLKVAKDEPWGTERDPQSLRLRVRTKVKVTAQWELQLRSKVEPPEHGPPPGGKLCTGGAFKLCVAKDSIAPEVRKRIDAEIVPRMEKALEEADRQLEAAAALRTRLEQAWRALSKPQQFDNHGRWVVIEPRMAALELRAEGDAIVVEPAVFARVSYHEGKPKRPSSALPDKVRMSELPGERMQLPAELAPKKLRQLLDQLSSP